MSPDNRLTDEQLIEIKGKIQSCCCYIQYQGSPKPHVTTVASYVKRKLNIRKFEDIPQSRFYDALRIISSYKDNHSH